MADFTIPNLDAMDADELASLEICFACLAAYCGHKAKAMKLRTGGDVDAALAFERAADAQYKKLPDWLRW